MSRKDFAQRSKRKNKRTSSPSQQPERPPAPPKKELSATLIALLILLLGGIAALIYGLIFTPQPKQPEQTADEQQAKPTPQQNKQPNLTPLAEKREPGDSLPLDDVEIVTPEERFEFYENLKREKVEIPKQSAYVSTPKDAPLKQPYRLQTGSFRTLKEAENQRARLILAGLSGVEISEFNGTNGRWHRVTTEIYERYNTLKQAEKILESLNIRPIKRKVEP